MTALRALACALALVLPACSGPETNDRCLFDDLAVINGRTNVVSVDDTVTFQASLADTECLPGGLEPVEWRWSSSDTRIAAIDSLTGLALGVGPGSAVIQVQHVRNVVVQATTTLEVVGGTAASRRIRRILTE